MKFFGARQLNPFDDEVLTVPAPVGDLCGHCREPIAAGDDGWLIPYGGGPNEPCELAFHHACHLREIVGSVAHQQKRCSCFVPGSQAEDDPLLTRRQAAEAAMTYFYQGRSQSDGEVKS